MQQLQQQQRRGWWLLLLLLLGVVQWGEGEALPLAGVAHLGQPTRSPPLRSWVLGLRGVH